MTPVTITVVNGDAPVADVRITLFNIGADTSIWSCGGITNASGVATISSSLRTNVKPGAKPGTYKVILVQSVSLPPELLPTATESEAAIPNAPLQAKRAEYLEKSRVVPQKFGEVDTTPIELTVPEKTSAALTVDVAKY